MARGDVGGFRVDRDWRRVAEFEMLVWRISLVAHVVEDFFTEYGDVHLPTGEPAKLAMYFPQTDDVRALRPVIEAKLAEMGIPPTVILEHHTANDEKEEFDRFRLPTSMKRVALLVDRGTEGWNCPSLFACALVRKLANSNNFVLQAATRCLPQVQCGTCARMTG